MAIRRVAPWTLATLVLAAGCPSAEEVVEEKPACDLTLDTLAGKTFVRQVRTPDGKNWEEDTWARARFFADGDKLKVKYNTRALVDMYTYTCEKTKGEQFCRADNPDLAQWCRTLYAASGVCTGAEIAQYTGAPLADANAAAAEVNAGIAKMTDDQKAALKASFSQPNNQLRGVLHVKVNEEECRINVKDLYQTMTFGELRELENVVGNARFVPSDADLVFEHCSSKEQNALVALPTPDATGIKPGMGQLKWPAGSEVTFQYAGEENVKPEAGCTYTMDSYVTYAPKEKGVAVSGDPLTWRFSHKFDKAGKYVVHAYQNKACGGGEPALANVTCAVVLVEGGEAPAPAPAPE